MSAGLGRFHQNAEIPVNPRRISMGEGALAVLAINEAAIFEVTQCEPDCNTTDIKSPTKLVLARNGEGGWFVPVKNFFRDSSDKAGSGGRRTLGSH